MFSVKFELSLERFNELLAIFQIVKIVYLSLPRYSLKCCTSFIGSGCGPVVNDTLKSPGYPENYPANMDCTSAVPIPQGQEMEIYLSQFELEDSQSCA